jgi:SAM-dependent methyltransferase
MHKSVLAWINTALTEEDIAGKRVLEVGSYNVNGSVRPIITAYHPSEYLGVDQAAGPGVDEVLDCSALIETFGAGSWDVVVSTEMLEHVRDWRACVRNLIHVVAPGGLLVITTRSPGFPYHPFPEDHWRYPVAAFERILANARLDQLNVRPDPEAPGVFVKARKPEGWRPPRGNPWVGVGVEPVNQGAAMSDEKPAESRTDEATREPAKAALPRNDKMIAALLRERAGLAALGKDERVAQVDEQLIHYGYDGGEKKATARKQPPQGRSSKPQQTGD